MKTKSFKLYERKWRTGKGFNFQTEFAIVSPADIVTFYFLDNVQGYLPLIISYEGNTTLEGQSLKYLQQFENWKKSKLKTSQSNLSENKLPIY